MTRTISAIATVSLALLAGCGPRVPLTPDEVAFRRQLLLEQARNWHPYVAPPMQAPQTVTTNCFGGNGLYQCTSSGSGYVPLPAPYQP